MNVYCVWTNRARLQEEANALKKEEEKFQHEDEVRMLISKVIGGILFSIALFGIVGLIGTIVKSSAPARLFSLFLIPVIILAFILSIHCFIAGQQPELFEFPDWFVNYNLDETLLDLVMKGMPVTVHLCDKKGEYATTLVDTAIFDFDTRDAMLYFNDTVGRRACIRAGLDELRLNFVEEQQQSSKQ